MALPQQTTEPPARLARIAFLAIHGLSAADQEGSATEYLKALPDESAWALVKCLRRNGWWFPNSDASPQVRLLDWMNKDGAKTDVADGAGHVQIERQGDRIADAAQAIERMVSALCFSRTSCLAVLRIVQALLQRTAQHDPPLFSRITRNWPDEMKWKNPTGDWQKVTDDPGWQESSVFNEFCHRFDAELLDAELFDVESNLQLPHFRIVLPQPTGHILNDEIYVKRDVVRWLEGWHDHLLRESQNRRELPLGWEPDGSRWPEGPIQNVVVLREWLKLWLGNIHEARSSEWLKPESYIDDIRRELRNTRRAVRAWGLSLPPEFSDTPADIHEAERMLELLIEAFGDFDHDSARVYVALPSPLRDRGPVWSNWAFGYDAISENWYLFHKSEGRWEKPSKVIFPGGLPSELMKLFAENGGVLNWASTAAWRTEREPLMELEKARRSLIPILSRMRNVIKNAVSSAGKFDVSNISDPIPLTEDKRDWIAAVEIGFAMPNDAGHLEFKRKEDL